MNSDEFRKQAHLMVDWMADYLEHVEDYPVKSQVAPRTIYDQINSAIPKLGEDMEHIFNDFKEIIIPGITHWQNPNFFAYFQANTSPPSILAEMLTATLGVQGMKWETSPAATELEERMMEWLGDGIGIPKLWAGVIQDSASMATLSAILTARERLSKYQINEKGFEGYTKLRVYCSDQTHSSIEKGAKIAGVGKSNVIKIPTNDQLEMRSDLLRQQIESDIKQGYQPLCIVAALGTTGTMAMDPLEEIGMLAEKHNIWLHVDAAYAGAAFLLPEHQSLMKGIEKADSFVFNPHKWLFTNYDCTAFFVKDKKGLLNTFSILPEYLKTASDGLVNNYCDWGIPLGRRFRSLKLWFVMRHYGLEGLQKMLRLHIALAEWLEAELKKKPTFEMVVPRSMNLICFRYMPEGVEDQEQLNTINEQLLQSLNASGELYLTHTKIDGKYTLRMSIGQTNVTQTHLENAWKNIQELAHGIVINE
ncbi:amino acid decarboxylase [Sediminicola sp. YIK13]|uniref:pyridoxal phosphate-dependent decarboxylase family protein n=1 Tax=Sediminicola sp. YIK13 TaxID=1453352 RepID=UPI0007226DFA|nr:aminotransferase class I/II-fold pyridoxal phosphate-dependent enzyme [Sediminicola sp. YIK13]ALM08352.1 amino acid decarboxylase [Sediminicola sp. YIK13]